jgi:large repetitive protein
MPRFLGLVVGALAVMLFALQSGQAFAAHVTCGDVITQDTTLDSDLADCTGDGLVIGADGVTLDLGGNTVDGTGIGCGIANGHHECDSPVEDGYERVIVRNGAVSQFYIGVGVTAADDNALLDLRVRSCDAHGLSLFEASGTLIEGNVVTGSGRGIFLEADGNTIRRNRFSHNGGHGIEYVDSGRDRIEGNVVSHNGGDGIHGLGFEDMLVGRNLIAANSGHGLQAGDSARGNRIEGNRIQGNGSGGIYMQEGAGQNRIEDNWVLRNGGEIFAAGALYIGDGDENVIRNNHISANSGSAAILLDYQNRNNLIAANHLARNSGDGIVLHPEGVNDNLVEANHLSRNGGDGIRIEAGAIANVVRRNHAVGNTDDGMDSDSAFTTFALNMAVRNGDLGIEAVPGAIDADGNRASSNGNPLQCLFVACR